MTIEVVHLVWRPAGLEPFRKFLDSYRRHPAGVDHGLVFLFNGFAGADLGAHREAIGNLEHREIVTPRSMFDLAAYFWVAEQSSARFLCFVNSYSEILVEGWLAALHSAVGRPGVGSAGATGSWESFFTNYERRIREAGRPRTPLDWAKHLNRVRKLRRFRANFDPAPNPHLRSNAFVIERARWLELRHPPLTTKWQTWLFESGKQGMAAQLRAMGLELAVVGRDGVAYASPDWARSRTFRLGGQENLLVADNRTRQYDQASEEEKRYMREIAWGAG